MNYVREGRRMRLRSYTLDDFKAWLAWPHYPHPADAVMDPPQIAGIITPEALWKLRPTLSLAIEDLDGRFVGDVSLYAPNGPTRTCMMVRVHPQRLGEGIGTEATAAAIDHCWETGLRELFFKVTAFRRSLGVYRRLGCHQIGTEWRGVRPREADWLRNPSQAHLKKFWREQNGQVEALTRVLRKSRPSRR